MDEGESESESESVPERKCVNPRKDTNGTKMIENICTVILITWNKKKV